MISWSYDPRLISFDVANMTIKKFFFSIKENTNEFLKYIFIEPKFDSKNVDFKEITILFQTYKIVKVLVPQDKNTDSMFISYKF